MRRQQLVARKIRRRNGLTRQDRTAPKFPDLVKRDFTADAPNRKWVGDMTEIPTDHGKLYLATVIDLYSRRLLGAATGLHPDADLACQAIRMAVAARGGQPVIAGVIFHTDRGSTYTATSFTKLCDRLGIRQSMGRVGSCFDNAAAEAFFSSLEWEVLSRHTFHNPGQAQPIVMDWCYGFYNHQRRHRRRRHEPDQLRNHRPQPRRGLKETPHETGGTTDRLLHPWCDAPRSDRPHRTAADGGPTTYHNAAALCERCNHTRETPRLAGHQLPQPTSRNPHHPNPHPNHLHPPTTTHHRNHHPRPGSGAERPDAGERANHARTGS